MNTAAPPAPSPTVTRELGQGQALYERAQAHLERLSDLDHPAVCCPQRIDMADDGLVVATLPALDGIDLDALVRTRGPLSVGECVTVGLGVSQALDALHRVGLVHGDVSAANIMIVDGEIVLVDAWGEVLTDEVGTAACAAPERASAGPTAASDVFALGTVLRDAVSEVGADRLDAWTAPMLAADPAARPPAAMVARALPSCAEPAGIDVPRVGIASEVRARAQGPVSRTERLDSGRGWRVWRVAMRVLVWAGVAAGAAVMVLMAAALVQRAMPIVSGSDAPALRYVRTLDQPSVAAAALTHARFAALARGDGDALMATTVPDSAAAMQGSAEAAPLSNGEVEFSGLSVHVDDVETVAAGAHDATVFVEYTVSAHQVRDGEQLFTYESYTQRVEMSLSWHSNQWRVRQVQPLPPPTGPPT